MKKAYDQKDEKTNSETLKLIVKRSSAVEACWAHNSKVGGSKPPSAIFFSSYKKNRRKERRKFSRNNSKNFFFMDHSIHEDKMIIQRV